VKPTEGKTDAELLDAYNQLKQPAERRYRIPPTLQISAECTLEFHSVPVVQISGRSRKRCGSATGVRSMSLAETNANLPYGDTSASQGQREFSFGEVLVQEEP
jgi:hypothetical protein